MTSAEELRKRFLNFFESKGHTIVPSSSLLSEDPTVLLTTAGMQQFKPYYTGEKDPERDIHPGFDRPLGTKNAVSIQKSFRTSDIDEVGDESHLTFFEMLGNFSFGGYFKEEAITYAHEFIKKELNLAIEYVTVFEGDTDVPSDVQAEKVWQSLGISDVRYAGRKDNFWGPTGTEGPCGPTTEIYVKNSAGNDIEIWTLVFNEYYCHPGKELTKLATPGVDTGMGLERLAMVARGTRTIFETDLFENIINILPAGLDNRKKRIISDHIRASCFLITDGVQPENKGAGYVLRRLLRRMIAFDPDINFSALVNVVVSQYQTFYKKLHKESIMSVITEEQVKFNETLRQGMAEITKFEKINATDAFKLFSTFGIPFEVIKDVAGDRITDFSQEDFDKQLATHQKISRAGAEKKFKGGLADTSEEVVKLHTATHLLNAALRKVLGDHVWQKGSNITAERTRFDFTHTEKMTPEQTKEVETLVNEWIKADLTVKREEMRREEAEKLGALGVFGEKYPDVVSIYTIYDTSSGEAVSREFCGGPHVEHTGELGFFSIIKEESSSAGVRRIRARLEK
jgi:alanyl-tRNA synthetase